MSRLAYTDRFHQYALDGRRVPSVTAITGSLDKPALAAAAAKEAALFAARNADGLQRMDPDAWVKTVAAAPREVWNRKADDGRILHVLAESMIHGTLMPEEVKGEPVPDHVRDMAEQLARFFDAWDVTPVLHETMVFHETYRYAGRFDLCAELAHDGRWLLDYKTGSGVYPESSLQLTAYGYATHYVTADNEDRPMPELGIYRAGVVWIRPDTWELVPVKYDDDVFRAFLHCGAVHSWAKQSREVSVLDPMPRPVAS